VQRPHTIACPFSLPSPQLAVEEIRFVYRSFGAAGDMVLFLKDGAKVELRHVPKFDEIYTYVMSQCDSDCQAKSMKLAKKSVA